MQNEDRKQTAKYISNYARNVVELQYARMYSNELKDGFRVKLWFIKNDPAKIKRIKEFCIGLGAKKFKQNSFMGAQPPSLSIYF